MKGVKISFLLLFALVLLVPLAAFRREPGVVSEIDNRMLQENPFDPEERAKGGDLTVKLENYVRDRIGFRDDMILGYTVLNDRVFGKMVHPSYCYGKEGWVYVRPSPPASDRDYCTTFADMVVQVWDYCEARDVPFLFVWEPMKETVLSKYLPVGVNHDRRGSEIILSYLEEKGVPVLDMTALLRERAECGEIVFNREYDAFHWNELGGFYVGNAILQEMKKDFPCVHINTLDEFRILEKLETSLPTSKFPIYETVPLLEAKADESVNTKDAYAAELRLDGNYRSFGYYVNSSQQTENSPRTLMFQGSHMNGYGYKFLKNALGEYIFIHNYQNILNFDYYFSVFQPEYVIFEVAESPLRVTSYFNYERMKEAFLPPALNAIQETAGEPEVLALSGVSVQQGEALTVISWAGGDGSESCVWAELGDTVFDLRRSEAGGWEVTVKNEVWDQYGDSLRIAALAGEILREYQ